MDLISVMIGIVIGIVGSVIFVAMTSTLWADSKTISRPYRISKGDLTCRECDTEMVESSPSSGSARRFFDCPACNRSDSYIDHDRVAEYRRATPRAPS